MPGTALAELALEVLVFCPLAAVRAVDLAGVGARLLVLPAGVLGPADDGRPAVACGAAALAAVMPAFMASPATSFKAAAAMP